VKSQITLEQDMKIKTYLEIESQKTYTGKNRRSKAGSRTLFFF